MTGQTSHHIRVSNELLIVILLMRKIVHVHAAVYTVADSRYDVVCDDWQQQ
jgi:hypothetical protein